ncbi:hypothetical protein CDAR_482151 [Caerostris darwini]|uniref:Uncharacterized protein n=1 Tax=Caerostris darwini TaxID=1538125 RepID=A0AAV4TG91_9ARAC|nr:hypothetical protein CDAR_482151 [Caerostris darwini]
MHASTINLALFSFSEWSFVQIDRDQRMAVPYQEDSHCRCIDIQPLAAVSTACLPRPSFASRRRDRLAVAASLFAIKIFAMSDAFERKAISFPPHRGFIKLNKL